MIKQNLVYIIGSFIVLTILLMRENGKLYDYKPFTKQSNELNKLLKDMLVNRSCPSCKTALPIIKTMNKNIYTRKILYSIIMNLCKKNYYNDDKFCRGILNLFGKWYLEVLDKINPKQKEPDLTQLMCYVINKICPVPKLPIPILQLKELGHFKKPKSAHKLNIIQISDLHIDYKYRPISEADCDFPICCRNPRHNIKRPANYWGEYSCDTSFNLFKSMIHQIKTKTNKENSIIILTGDILPHDIWDQDKNTFKTGIHNTLEYLSQELTGYLVFTAIGNHESVPVNYFPLDFMNNKPVWSYGILADKLKTWIGESQQTEFKKYGRYSQNASKTLKIISMNTNMCNSLNFWLPILFDRNINNNSKNYDPDQSLNWLAKTLHEAYEANQYVLIIGHIAPGDPDCYYFWSSSYNKIIKHYSEIIKGQYFGHTHLDTFEVFYRNDTAYQIAFIAPSVSPFIQLDPAFRIYNYNKEFNLIDHKTFTADLSMADKWTGNAEWKLEYSARETYFAHLSNDEHITAKMWDVLTKKLQINDQLFDRFYSSVHRSKNFNYTDQIRKDIVCTLRSSINCDECNPDPPIDRH